MPKSGISRRQFLVQSVASTSMFAMGACQPTGRGPRGSSIREAAQVVSAVASADGAGVKLHRALGHARLAMLDPFLLLDEIHSSNPEDYQAGFPSHPHRGFETVSYLISGAFEHRDSVGNHGLIGAGDCQWMTAGRGIVHSEMPRAAAGQDLWGLQLWVNLPAAQKMRAPRYQDRSASEIPEGDRGDARVRVVTGSLGSLRGPVEEIAVAPTMLEVRLPAGGLFQMDLPEADNCFAYMLNGQGQFGARAQTVSGGELAILNEGRQVMASSEQGARFLLVSAKPIGEPVARRGPFVMNTEEEVRQAFADYQSGRLIGG